MTRQLNPRQIAWRVAQDLPHGSHVTLGTGMPLLVRDHVPAECGIVFEYEGVPGQAVEQRRRDTRRVDYCVLGAREVAQNGDLVAREVAADTPRPGGIAGASACPATAGHVFVICEYFAPDGRPVLVPQCSVPPSRARSVTRLFTDIAVFDLRDGKVWLCEIIEGITLHVLQAETDVQLHIAPDLRLLNAPDLR